MGTLTIRDLDDALKTRLRLLAASRNRSMEEEARQILRAALQQAQTPGQDLGAKIHARFAALGGLDLALAAREPMREPPDLGTPKPARAARKLGNRKAKSSRQ